MLDKIHDVLEDARKDVERKKAMFICRTIPQRVTTQDSGDLLELSGDPMQYVMIEERLVESLQMKWEDAKRTKLEYYIANVNPECWSQYKARILIDRIQLYLITNMSSNAHRAVTPLRTRSHRLGIKVT